MRFKALLISFCLLTLLSIGFFLIWAWQLNHQMSERLEKGWFLPPIEIYSDRYNLKIGSPFQPKEFAQRLDILGFQKTTPGDSLRPLEYSLWSPELCQQHLSEELGEFTQACVVFVSYIDNSSLLNLIAYDQDHHVSGIYQGEPLLSVQELNLPPLLFAQYYGDQPILRQITLLSDIPFACLQAVTAIEDSDFLDHVGISVSGTLRALMRNIASGRYAQGGSTITQQLVKNFFLTPEKTIKRKITEQIMSLLLETRVSKDEILQTYLNLIYLGQNGPFQIRGYASASRHYLNKPLSELNLPECALLAAIINNPGRYNPFSHPENALQRRQLVLEKMKEFNMLDEENFKAANAAPLPQVPPRLLSEPAPYYVQGLLKWVDQQEISKEEGLRIYTHLSPTAQEMAQNSLSQEVKRLEKDFKYLQQLKEQGKNLQAALISIDLHTNGVIALVGGREFKKSQYNRAMDSRRQVGSIMKPFVYLAALEGLTPEGEDYTPLTLISDEPLDYKYEGQRWQPSNYDHKFHGEVPLFVGLKESLNVATARLGIDVGLTSIVDIARRLGIQSPVKALPSLSLGAFELSLWEVTRAYAAIAQMGRFGEIQMIRRIENGHGELLWTEEQERHQAVTPEAAARLVGMMKQTVESGTARSVRWRGFSYPAAGKTGTTSDTKDAWFVGFTPHVLTVVWVGYDDNTPHRLTGSSGAVPLWTQFMKSYATQFPGDDFPWPEGVEEREVPLSELYDLMEASKNLKAPQEGLKLVF